MSYVVPPEALSDVWPKVSDWLERAVVRNQGDENLLDVLLAIARGKYQLWYAPDKFAAVVEITRYPRQIVATVVYCGGKDLQAMKAAWDFGCQWAKANGIAVVRTWGRPGWERVLGMKKQGVILQARL